MNYHYRLLIIPVLVALSAFSVAAQDCRRHVEPAGGFSYCLPEGWTVETRENQKFKQLFAPRNPTFTANINVKDEASASGLRTYVANAIRLIISSPSRVGATSIKLSAWADFITASQLRGERIAFETEYKGLLVRTVQYYFDDGQDRKLILTGTYLVSDKDTFDPIFDRTAKSFRLGR